MKFLRILRNVVNVCSKRPIYCQFIRRKYGEATLDTEKDDLSDREYEELARSYLPYGVEHSCFIIHPYIKWGPQKAVDTNPKYQLDEAVSLIHTLDTWTIHKKLSLPVDNFDKKTIFGSGNLEKLKETTRNNPKITTVFINISTLKTHQKDELERHFRVPVFDRYHIVMLILKLHASSKHAKLQVALAEITYLQSRMKKHNLSADHETRKRMLQIREQKIKDAIKKLRTHRELLRTNRKRSEHPVIAVVGYTNSGKTSLIKALTKDASLEPRDRLFATLDVTLHAGFLPSRLKVLYVDTVGFMSNIPTTLIECFVATLEDALFADVILHVTDLANENLLHQRNHVKATLENLALRVGNKAVLEKIITVGNKCDLVEGEVDPSIFRVSAKTEFGTDALREELERAVLSSTGMRRVTVKVTTGGDEMRWLYKNATVSAVEVNEDDCQFQNVSVIISQGKLQQFKHHFIVNSR